MDPLSDVLSLLKPETCHAGGLDTGEHWSIRLQPPPNSTKCIAILSGSCWMAFDDRKCDPIHLHAGDIVVLPHGRAFRLASDLNLPPVPWDTLISAPLSGRTLRWNGGGHLLGLSASFTFRGEHVGMLLSLLSPVIHIRDHSDTASMRWYMERMTLVLRGSHPGSDLLVKYLSEMLLVEALRSYISRKLHADINWLSALTDQQISAVLKTIHDRPGEHWSVQSLAKISGMSRSIFAARFKQKVGVSPMEYLTHWRILRAADQLIHTSNSIFQIAQSFGYESESAFGLAFKRVTGCSPRRYSHGLCRQANRPNSERL